MAATITAYKEQAARDARAELDNDYKRLDVYRQELATAKKKQKSEAETAKQKAYNDNELLIKVLTVFCVVVGIIEGIKHIAVIGVYKGWYTWLVAQCGLIAGNAITVVGASVPIWAYFATSSYPLWAAYRLIAVIGMLMLADVLPVTKNFNAADITAIIMYVAGWIIAGGRYWISKL